MFEPLTRNALRLVNHVLAGEAWALERLRPHRGAALRVEAGWLTQTLIIDEHGLLQTASSAGPADVTISLPDDFARRWLVDRKQLLSAVQIAGSADVAEVFAFVFRNLRWDIEADLARYVGDIAAHRLARLGRSLGEQAAESLQRATQNVVEYLSDESGQLIARPEWAEFSARLADTGDCLNRLEQRIARL